MFNSGKNFKILFYLFSNIILQNQIYVNCFNDDIDEFDNPFDKNFIDEDGTFGSQRDSNFNQFDGLDFQSTFNDFHLNRDDFNDNPQLDKDNYQNQPSHVLPKVPYPPPRPVNNYKPYINSDAPNAPYNSQQNKANNSYNPNLINPNSHPIPSYDHISRPHLSHIHPGPPHHSHLHPSNLLPPNELYPNQMPPNPFPMIPGNNHNPPPNYYPPQTNQDPVRPYPVNQKLPQPIEPSINHKPPYPFPINPNNSLNSGPNNYYPMPSQQGGPVRPYPVIQTPPKPNEPAVNNKPLNPFPVSPDDSLNNNVYPQQSPSRPYPVNQAPGNETVVNQTLSNSFVINNANQYQNPNNLRPSYSQQNRPYPTNQNQPSPSLANEPPINPRPPYPFPVNPNQPTNRPQPINPINQQNNQQIRPNLSNSYHPNMNIESRPDPYQKPSNIQKQNNSKPLGQTTDPSFNLNQNIMEMESNNNYISSDQNFESHLLEGSPLSGTAFEIPSPIFPVIPNNSNEFDFEEELADIGFDFKNSLPLMVSQNLLNETSNTKQDNYNPFHLRKVDQLNMNFSPESAANMSFIPVIDPQILNKYSKLKMPVTTVNKQQKSLSPVLFDRNLEELDDDLSESDLLMKNYPDSISESMDDENNSENIPTLLPLIDFVKDEPLSLNSEGKQSSLNGLTDLTIDSAFPSITESTTLASIGFQFSNELIETKEKKNYPGSLLPFLEPDFDDTIAMDDNLYQLQEQNVNLNPDFSRQDQRIENDLNNKNLDSNSDTVIKSTDSSIDNKVDPLKDLINPSSKLEAQSTTDGKDRKLSEKSRIKLTPWNVHKMSSILK